MQELTHAESFKNGIIFFSNYNKNYGSKTTINKEGKIYTQWSEILEVENETTTSRKTLTQKFISPLKSAVYYSLVAYMLYNIFVEKNALTLTLLLILRTLSIIGALIPIIDFITQTNEKRFQRFHAAEHMAINAYQKLGRAPSLEEIRHFSRLTNFCGTNTFAEKRVYFLLIFVCSFISNPFIMWIVTMMICSETLIHLLSILGFFNVFQLLTTSKPTDTELKVAITGLETWIENEPQIENPEELTLICISITFPR